MALSTGIVQLIGQVEGDGLLQLLSDLGSPASPDNCGKALVAFGGRVEHVHVQYIKQ
jgi:hypothetical protein